MISGTRRHARKQRVVGDDVSDQHQLEKILERLHRSDVSFHDLSWMVLDDPKPRTPRFNMPFELGLAVGLRRWCRPKHQWFVFDQQRHRLPKALSDLAGMPRHEYNGTARGLLLEMMNIFPPQRYRQASIDELMRAHDVLSEKAKQLKKDGHASLFTPNVFQALKIAGHKEAQRIRKDEK